MAKRTLSGFYGILIIPDDTAVRTAVDISEKKRVREAAYRVKPEGVHLTLYQARTFVDLPVEFAQKLVGKLNECVVRHRSGELLLHLLDVEPYSDNPQFLFWNVDKPHKNQRLLDAHGMSLALSAWVEPEVENASKFERRIADYGDHRRAREQRLYTNMTLYGHTLVGEQYLPHITIAADPEGFKKFKPYQEPHIGCAVRVVFARMGEWGKIEEILH